MTERGFWLEAGGVRLWTRKWSPDVNVKAVINIVHGMLEHGGRYRELAAFLCAEGFEVWCADMRGHGKTADLSVNNEREGGLLGHCADKKGFRKTLQDIDMVQTTIKKEHRNIPLFLLGHSWGSFLTQGYIELFGGKFAGVILSGTRGVGSLDAKTGAPLLKFLSWLSGVRTKSSFVYKLVFGSYNKHFAPCRTEYDWLSRDKAEVDAYLADPLCGGIPTIGFFYDMTIALQQIHKTRNIEKFGRNLPIYIISGCKDPVGGMSAGITALLKKYKAMRIKDLSCVLYPDARHECLHETNRNEVMRNLLTWLETHL